MSFILLWTHFKPLLYGVSVSCFKMIIINVVLLNARSMKLNERIGFYFVEVMEYHVMSVTVFMFYEM